jgi:hypothetical protein
VGGVGDAAGQFAQVPLGTRRSGQRLGTHAPQQLGDGGRGVDHLPGRHAGAALGGVADAQVHRVHAERGGELVHL